MSSKTTGTATASRAPSRAARVRSLATALGATRRPLGRARANESRGAAAATAGRARATAAAGVSKEAAARELAAQATALEDAIRDLSQRLIATPDVEAKREILEQQRLLREALLTILGKQVQDAFDEDDVRRALERLAGITEKLQREAKLLKTATNFVKRTADVIGFVEEGLGVLASVGLLA